jgi:hypothetical protein
MLTALYTVLCCAVGVLEEADGRIALFPRRPGQPVCDFFMKTGGWIAQPDLVMQAGKERGGCRGGEGAPSHFTDAMVNGRDSVLAAGLVARWAIWGGGGQGGAPDAGLRTPPLLSLEVAGWDSWLRQAVPRLLPR